MRVIRRISAVPVAARGEFLALVRYTRGLRHPQYIRRLSAVGYRVKKGHHTAVDLMKIIMHIPSGGMSIIIPESA